MKRMSIVVETDGAPTHYFDAGSTIIETWHKLAGLFVKWRADGWHVEKDGSRAWLLRKHNCVFRLSLAVVDWSLDSFQEVNIWRCTAAIPLKLS